MVKKLDQNHASKPAVTSQLERFQLGFEYDKTLQEIRRDVRTRTHGRVHA